MVDAKDRRMIHVEPGGGEAMWMPEGELVSRKVVGKQTGGAYSLFEVAVLPGGAQLPHVQHRAEECLYVLEGQFGVLCEGAELEAAPGSVVYVPKGKVHAYKNVGTMAGRLLIVHTPGGSYDSLFEEIGEPMNDVPTSPKVRQPPDLEEFTAAAARYGVEVVAPPP